MIFNNMQYNNPYQPMNNNMAGGIGYPVPPAPIANIGGQGYNDMSNGLTFSSPLVEEEFKKQMARYNQNPQGMYQPPQQYQNPYAQPNQGYNPYGGYQQPQYQQPQYQNPYMQGNPVYGNMGGYYTNNTQYYNPYLAKQQMQLQQAQWMETQKQQATIWKMISRNVHKSLGEEVSEEYLSSIYDPQPIDMKQYELEQNVAHMAKLEVLSNDTNYQARQETPAMRFLAGAVRRQQEFRQAYPENMDMVTFLNTAGEILVNADMEKYNRENRKITNFYNPDSYESMIDKCAPTANYYSNLLNHEGVSINDKNQIEITLPQSLKNEYEARRKKFLDSILVRNS